MTQPTLTGSAAAEAAIDACDAAYRTFGMPDELRNRGLDRLRHGLSVYGDDAYQKLTEIEWLNEALEELFDAFNMLTGMREARGEHILCSQLLARTIRIVATEIEFLESDADILADDGSESALPPLPSTGPPAFLPPARALPPLPSTGPPASLPASPSVVPRTAGVSPASLSAVPPSPAGRGTEGEAAAQRDLFTEIAGGANR